MANIQNGSQVVIRPPGDRLSTYIELAVIETQLV